MDKRYYTSLGILLGLVLVAWAFGPSNYQPVNDGKVTQGANDPGPVPSENLANPSDSGSHRYQESFSQSPTLVQGGDSASRVPKSLFNGTWSTGRSTSKTIESTGQRPSSDGLASGEKSRNAESREDGFQHASAGSRPNAILLGPGNSRSVRSSQASASLSLPSVAPGKDGHKETSSSLASNLPTDRIPGRKSDREKDSASPTGPGSFLSLESTLRDRERQAASRAGSSLAGRGNHGSFGIGSDSSLTSGQSSLAANLDMQRLASQLTPIRKGTPSVSRRPEPFGYKDRFQSQEIATDPLFRPVTRPRTRSQGVGFNRGDRNGFGGNSSGSPSPNSFGSNVRGLPFAMAGHNRNRQMAGTESQSKVGIPGQKTTSNPLPVRRNPVFQQEYIWHVLSSNETLESIATSYDGGRSMVKKMIQMNRDVFQDPKLLPVGKAIRIPVQ